MKRITLSSQAVKFFRQLTAGLDDANLSKKIDNNPEGSGIMPVSVEFLGKVSADGRTYSKYSITHYYEQEGDLMADPDVTFLAVDGCDAIYPASFRQDGGLACDRTYAWVDDQGRLMVNETRMADLACFCTKWFRNIKSQQKL